MRVRLSLTGDEAAAVRAILAATTGMPVPDRRVRAALRNATRKLDTARHRAAQGGGR